jgi:hypothetical protein
MEGHYPLFTDKFLVRYGADMAQNWGICGQNPSCFGKLNPRGRPFGHKNRPAGTWFGRLLQEAQACWDNCLVHHPTSGVPLNKHSQIVALSWAVEVPGILQLRDAAKTLRQSEMFAQARPRTATAYVC